MLNRRTFVASMACAPLLLAAEQASFPEPSKLPSVTSLPDPLLFLDGSKVADKDAWFNKRKPELKQLFQHYMYGYYPAKTVTVTSKVLSNNAKAFSGKGVLKEIEISYGPPSTPTIKMLLAIPAERKGKVPVFIGMNFAGNHVLVDDAAIKIPTAWMYDRYPGVVNNQATEKGRGTQKDTWNIEETLAEGFAVATFYSGDVDPDVKDKRMGIQPHLEKAGVAPTGKNATNHSVQPSARPVDLRTSSTARTLVARPVRNIALVTLVAASATHIRYVPMRRADASCGCEPYSGGSCRTMG